MERRFFGVVDYIVFGTSLVVSLGIGVWFSLSGGRQRTNHEYLLGNRSMGWFPVALSLLASTIAAGTVLGHPAEMYLYGTTFAFAWVGINLAAPVAAWVWVPLLHPLKLTSANEYLEMRFGSIAVRRLNCVYAYLSFITFSGVCLFGPSVAIQLVTGFPVWGAIILSGGIATIYTSIGGMKAVIWTDVFQALTMLAGILAVTIQGCILVGGGNKVWNTAERGGRILADTSFDPRTRMTVLGAAVGQFIMWFFTGGVWQPAVQRFSSVDNLRSAQWSVIGTLSGTLTIGPLACFAGIVMFAYYFLMGCDPLAANYITTPDQLMVHFVMEVLDYPGVPGLFVAATLSSSLSSSSSCINSASAILWEDLLSYRFPQASESTAASIAKISGAVTGVLSILTALATLYTGGTIVHAVIRFTQGALVPTAVLFVLAAAIPCANEKGAFVGSLVGLATCLWINVGALGINRHAEILPTVTTNCSTSSYNASIYQIATPFTSDFYTHSPNGTVGSTSSDSWNFLDNIYGICNTLVNPLSIGFGILVGVIASLLTGPTNHLDIDPRLLLYSVRRIVHGKNHNYLNKKYKYSRTPIIVRKNSTTKQQIQEGGIYSTNL